MSPEHASALAPYATLAAMRARAGELAPVASHQNWKDTDAFFRRGADRRGHGVDDRARTPPSTTARLQRARRAPDRGMDRRGRIASGVDPTAEPPRQADAASNGARPRRARTSGRRSGGSVFGGWRRCGTSASRCSVMSAILQRRILHRGGDVALRLRHPRHLADELTRRRLDLLAGGRWLEPAQLRDVSAHAGSVEPEAPLRSPARRGHLLTRPQTGDHMHRTAPGLGLLAGVVALFVALGGCGSDGTTAATAQPEAAPRTS